MKIIKNQGLCFGSLAFCCGGYQRCRYRDEEIKRLGLTMAEYMRLKKKFNKEIIKFSENKRQVIENTLRYGTE